MGSKPKVAPGPSAAEKAQEAQLAAEQKAEQKKQQEARLALARARLGGGGSVASQPQNNNSFLG